MPHYSSIRLFAPKDGQGRQREMPPIPAGVPSRVEGAGLYLNHGILIGELFGLDTAEALNTVNEVGDGPESLPRLFIADDFPVMIDLFEGVAERLAQAVDAAGRPRDSEWGRRLRASPLLAEQDDGRLVIESRKVELADLQEKARDIAALFRFARDEKLLVEMV